MNAQDRLVYQTADLSLGSLAGMTTSSTPGVRPAIDLDPDFQRRERWSVEKQSALIESFLLNVPVPPIYLSEDEYGQYSVVDGKQRLTAINAFMVGGLRLVGLESFTGLEKANFAALPDDLKNSLLIRPYVRIVTLLKQSDPLLKFEVFTRLNRGGEVMLAQELRKVAYRGPLSDLIYELAGGSTVLRKQLKITSVNSAPYIRMEDAEYVLRFFALMSTWSHFSGNLRDEMDVFMIKNRNLKKNELDKLRAAWDRATNACASIWGDLSFQRFTGTQWRSQFLAGMYDAEMLAVSSLAPHELSNAMSKGAVAIKGTAALFKDVDFDKAVRQGTNTPKSVLKRVTSIMDMLRAL